MRDEDLVYLFVTIYRQISSDKSAGNFTYYLETMADTKKYVMENFEWPVHCHRKGVLDFSILLLLSLMMSLDQNFSLVQAS